MDDEWDTLPHVPLTEEGDWDPSVLDSKFDDQWADPEQVDPAAKFDLVGNCCQRAALWSKMQCVSNVLQQHFCRSYHPLHS